jgi:hypothetical protein
LKPGQRISHLAVQLGARDQGRNRVNDQNVDTAGANQSLGDLEPLLAGIGLRDKQVIDVDSELASILRVHRMLGIDVGGHAACFLSLRYDVQRKRRLTARLWPVNLNDSAAWHTPDPDCSVQTEA